LAILVIGEKINASAREVRQALERRDKHYLQGLAKKQADSGADFIDVNVGTGKPKEEVAHMEWLVEIVQEVVDRPLAIDTADPQVLEAGLAKHRGYAMVNSITGEERRLAPFLSLAKKHHCSCIALAMGQGGVPRGAEQRLEVCRMILGRAQEWGIDKERIYFDPLVLPLSADPGQGLIALETIRLIKSNIADAKTVLGLSNISYGLPKRALINRVFLSMCLAAGLDSVILDPSDQKLLSVLRAAEALLGRDQYCKRYLKAYREGKLTD
jgi:5-methyltetrahydrofolate--homocysteine methyltransferase